MKEKIEKAFAGIRALEKHMKAYEYQLLQNQAAVTWRSAKEHSDYREYLPVLQKMIDTNIRFTGYQKEQMNPYDAMLDKYSKGLRSKDVDAFLVQIREPLVHMVAELKKHDAEIEDRFLYAHYPVEKQKKLNEYLLGVLGIDRGYCGFAETEHPFMSCTSNHDARITVHFYENNVATNLFSVIHESGHAIYELNIADELTYAFHIMIRYEIEKMVFRGEISVAEIPEIWNKKYKEYLGVEVSDDARGVLQDSHWSSGFFGYFIIYLLGSAQDAMLVKQMEKEFSVKEAVRAGEIPKITFWLTEHIHKYGYAKDPQEIMENACGGPVDGAAYVEYLKKKYEDVYGIIL